jgi:hypothetical protein
MPDAASAREGTLIVALGDSHTFGYGVSDDEAFPALMQMSLQKRYPSKSIQMVNLGIPGYNSAQQLATLKEFALRLKPDVILLGYLLNDIQRPRPSQATTTLGIKELIYSLERHVHLLRLILPHFARLARELGLGVQTRATREIDEYVNDGPAWQENKRTLESLIEYARDLDSELAVLVLPYMVQLDERHPPLPAYEAVVNFFRSRSIPVINAFDYFRGQDAASLWINLTDGHPNAKGHLLAAQAGLDLLRQTDSLTDEN